MLKRFVYYFVGCFLGLILVNFMFPGKLKDHFDYFSINKRVINQVVLSRNPCILQLENDDLQIRLLNNTF